MAGVNPLVSAPPSALPRMRIVMPCIALVVTSCMSFYGSIVFHLCPRSADEDFNASFTVPTGNCNCTARTVADPSQHANPSLYCQCEEETETGRNVTVVCHRLEPQLVEKECPKVEPQIVEKEVIREEKKCPYVPWHAPGRNWHFPASLPLCSMDTCFDFSRCDDADELLIYTYYEPLPPPRYLAFINESKWHTDDPSKACLFLVPLDHVTDPEQHVKKLPYWNHGMNHLLLTWTDKYSKYMPTGNDVENASIIASDMQETTYRPGFDISIPLPGTRHKRRFQSTGALHRKYLVTFKGLRYLGFAQDGAFRSAKEFREMHNGKDVIVATSCRQVTNNYFRKLHPELGAHCDEDQELFSTYNFDDLRSGLCRREDSLRATGSSKC